MKECLLNASIPLIWSEFQDNVIVPLGLGHTTIKLATTTGSTSFSPGMSVVFVVVPLSYSRRCRTIGAQDYDCDSCYDCDKAKICMLESQDNQVSNIK